MQVFPGPGAIGARAWNSLVAASGAPLFLRAEFLDALHESGAACRATGWEPEYLGLTRGGQLVAAVPLYRKHHSYGEYVFDWAWAEAYERHGLPYYPKLIAAIPFTPVPGSRLLAIDAAARSELARRLLQHAQATGLSSLHVLFPSAAEANELVALGLMPRGSVQFHWVNRGWASFDDFLAALAQPKRKKIRAERRKVAAAGIECELRVGRDIRAADWEFFYRCYVTTYAQHRSTAYLPLAFFLQVAAALPDAAVMVIAQRAGQPIAAALAYRDSHRLYGRYWGAIATADCLHFEVSYYQLIDYAIGAGLAVFEGGAQGEHKLARGFEAVATHSTHWISHPGFADAVARFLERESGGIETYLDELSERSALRPAR